MPSDDMQPVDCFQFKDGRLSPCPRHLVPEQPLRIMLDGEPVVTLMRMPGDETDLALGFLLTENLVRSVDDVGTISFCPKGEIGEGNEIRVNLVSAEARLRPLPLHRRVFSSCGICGFEAIEEVAQDVPPFKRPAGRLTPDDMFKLAAFMQDAQ